ncbi:hypothetical protein K504DRAFT_449989 [Pleomassaria siparia CBS 279.74]|uniref:Uncharacterized protein n=1 Tax=Pleomassaria siparia CBS 279.74 TaxID=1314801 RepID=A0A6G1KK36_9PLEO|nr:hypothetical protein K504DRAFT_449989 [Pleomassaria siparia CBS 279.74]
MIFLAVLISVIASTIVVAAHSPSETNTNTNTDTNKADVLAARGNCALGDTSCSADKMWVMGCNLNRTWHQRKKCKKNCCSTYSNAKGKMVAMCMCLNARDGVHGGEEDTTMATLASTWTAVSTVAAETVADRDGDHGLVY